MIRHDSDLLFYLVYVNSWSCYSSLYFYHVFFIKLIGNSSYMEVKESALKREKLSKLHHCTDKSLAFIFYNNN